MPRLLLAYILCLFFFPGISQPQIQGVSPFATTVGQYEKFEARVSLTASCSNPYDYDQVVLSARMKSPSGETFLIDGFYMQEYSLNSGNGTLTPSGNDEFRLRFSPKETGDWSYTVYLTDQNGQDSLTQQSFTCIHSTVSQNHGFVQGTSTNYLAFDDSSDYLPIGENMAWQNANAYLNYNQWLSELSANGGNFIRLWHAFWGLGIEWKAGYDNFSGLRRYKQTNASYQDWLFDHCADLGVYVMLCIHHHGMVSTGVNPNWSDSPYNTINGGPCANTWDFFTHATARAHTKNRLRYIVARWGYARSIMSWELFNEVDWTDNFETTNLQVAAWHEEMAAYLHTLDVYDRLITTSYARDAYDPELWQNPSIDFTQLHYYINTPHLERALVAGSQLYLDAFDKPVLVGEFGLGGSADLALTDPDGIHMHNAIWASLFGGSMGTGMTWWWDNYIHPRSVFEHFFGVSEVVQHIDFNEKNLAASPSRVTGVAGDFLLAPVLGWGDIADANIVISGTGTTTPATPRLSAFLYGSQWNTQFRSPPTFTVTYPAAGKFIVKTGSETGTSPKIAIWLNGNLTLDQAGMTNKEFSIQVQAGTHTIKVDNTGTDWITIQSYIFEGAGSGIDSYVLKSPGGNYAAGWMLNTKYNHTDVANHGEPSPATGATLLIDAMQNGSYSVEWYHCNTGDLLSSHVVSVNDQRLMLPVPDLDWDVAFILQKINALDEVKNTTISLRINPNPALAGEEVVVHTESIKGKMTFSLIDIHGKLVLQDVLQGEGKIRFTLPSTLIAGLYVLQLTNGRHTVSGTMEVLGKR